MKSIRCEKPFHFEMCERKMPLRQEGEALVRIRRIGICGTDLHAYKGDQPFFTYPRVLGHELSGEIVEVDDNPQGRKVGDQVVLVPYMQCGKCAACRRGKTNCCVSLELIGVHRDGGMCEFISMPTSHLLRAKGLSLDEMAIVECLSIGAHAVRRANIQKGQKVLVVGAGPIGMGALQFARIAGAETIVMDIDAKRLKYCETTLGAAHTIDATDDIKDQLSELTDGVGPDVIFEATGNPASMEACFEYVSHGGTYVFISLVKKDISFNDPEFHKREMTLMSSRNATLVDMKFVIEAIANKQVETETFITHHTAFDRMIGEYDSWLKPETGVIKAMVELE